MNSGGFYKIPLKRFESDLLPMMSSKFHEHRRCLEQLSADGDWAGVGGELKRCSASVRTLQQAISNLQQVRTKLDDSDTADFDSTFTPLRAQALRKLEQLNEYVLYIESLRDGSINSSSSHSGAAFLTDVHSGRKLNGLEEEEKNLECLEEEQKKLEVLENEQQRVRQRHRQLKQFQQLDSDMRALNDMMTDMASLTQQQGEMVDRVEDHVNNAQINVADGERQLAFGARLTGAVAPAAGALIGGLVAGPIGALAGAKAGGLALLGGGLIGYIGGRAVNAVRAHKGPTSLSEPDLLAANRKTTAPSRSFSLRSFLQRSRRPSPCEALDPVLSEAVDEAEEALAD